jgi:hypothetical protein
VYQWIGQVADISSGYNPNFLLLIIESLNDGIPYIGDGGFYRYAELNALVIHSLINNNGFQLIFNAVFGYECPGWVPGFIYSMTRFLILIPETGSGLTKE